jgi:aldehyde:ferredoxin oxidoreductase
VSDAWGGPEYETVAGFGSDCGINDLQAVAKANELCGRYTLDTISTGSAVAFAMECYEHGLIGPEDTGGLELRFGNAGAMVQAVEMIARREHIGDLLAEGTKRAAEIIGGDARHFAMQVKGLDLPMHEPRGKVGVGLGYAVNEAGADHLVAYHDPALANPESVSFKGAMALGITEALPVIELSRKKAANYAVLENWSSIGKTLGMCYFGPAPRSFIQVGDVVAAVRAATGWDTTVEE